MAYERKTIYVYENWSDREPRFLGTLYADQTRGTEHFSFEYAEDYLRDKHALIAIDPELMLLPGRQYVAGKPNFGVFSDSAPDRWGRTLMDRKERSRARRAGEKPRRLTESDYLLGLCDKTRMGALRFAAEKGGPFLSDDEEDAIPPWTSLRTLEEAARQFEKDENGLDDRWLNQLLQPTYLYILEHLLMLIKKGVFTKRLLNWKVVNKLLLLSMIEPHVIQKIFSFVGFTRMKVVV